MLRRRRFAAQALLALAGTHRSAFALPPARVGVLSVTDWRRGDGQRAAFVDELERLGHVEGRNLEFVVRTSGYDLASLDRLARELVDLQVDVILSAGGTPSALAAKRATSTIPIVMEGTRDPVADGLVASLARPGGNITGNADVGPELMVKRMQLVMEAAGTSGPVGYLAYEPNLDRVSDRRIVAALDTYARQRGNPLILVPVKKVDKGDGLEPAFSMLIRSGARAAVINNYATIGADDPSRVGTLALKCRMPAIMEHRSYALGGVLMTYTEPPTDMSVRAARMVDRILKGTKPQDLPVAQATRFDLVINLATAKALGLAIPEALQLRAEELIR